MIFCLVRSTDLELYVLARLPRSRLPAKCFIRTCPVATYPSTTHHTNRNQHGGAGFNLFFTTTNYVHHRTANSVYKSLPLDQRRLLVRDPFDITPFFSTSFGMQLGIITTDGKFVYCQRSSQVASSPNRIVCAVVEVSCALVCVLQRVRGVRSVTDG